MSKVALVTFLAMLAAGCTSLNGNAQSTQTDPNWGAHSIYRGSR